MSYSDLTIGDIFTITKGKKHEIVESQSIHSKRVIGIDDLRNDNLIRFTDDPKGTEVFDDDVLIAWDGANAGTIGYGKHGFIGSTIARLRFKEKGKFSAAYIGMLLKSKFDYLRQTATGATIPHISRKALEKISIPNISFEDQSRTSYLLGKVESLIHERKQSLEQLDKLLKSVFLDMFGDPKLNPKDFPVRKLSEFYIDPKTGTKCGPFGSALKKDEFTDSGIPVWNMDNIDPKGKPVMPFRMWITEEKFENLSAYEVYKGDILISRAGTVGKMCVSEVNTPSIISTNLIRLRLNPEKLNPIHFVSLMTYCASRVGRLKVGADGALTHMNTGILDTLEFPYPPPDLQKQFALIVDKAQKIKSRLSSTLSDLEMLYNALSQKAFKGELDLSGIKLQDQEVEPSSFEKLQQSIEAFDRLIPEPVKQINKIIPPSIQRLQQPFKDLNPLSENLQKALQFNEQYSQKFLGPFSYLELSDFKDPTSRPKILEHWVNEWLEDSQADELKLYRFWARAQCSLVDYLYEEDLEEFQFSVEDYDRVKELLFQAIDQSLIQQTTDYLLLEDKSEAGNRVVLVKE